MTESNFHRSHNAVASRLFSELEKTLSSEEQFLAKCIYENNSRAILDAGCGDGKMLTNVRNYCFEKLYVGIENDPELLGLAKKKAETRSGMIFDRGRLPEISYSDNTFDLVYSTNNTLGNLPKGDREKFASEMFRVSRREGYIAISTWKRDKDTTRFLKEYLPMMNYKVFEIDDDRIATDKGVFGRIDLILGMRELLPANGTTNYFIQQADWHDSGLYNMIVYRKC